MVFEHLFPQKLLDRKEWTAFVLAMIYSTISIVIARLLFPANSGITSVIFVSIFLIPYFRTMLRREERQEERDAGKTFMGLFQDNWDMIKAYVFIFFGIYLAYMLYSFLAPFLGYDVSSVFREQLSLTGVRGAAGFSFGTFWHILLNNWWVLLACFLVALVAGDGAIFFVAWNASAWGTIFGYRAVSAGLAGQWTPLVALLTIVVITFPHVFLEALAYILAAISGGVISDEVVASSEEIQAFVMYFIAAALAYVVVLLVSGMLLEDAVVRGSLAVIVALAILYAMQFLFSGRHRRVFAYNYELFVVAIVIFVVGAVIETVVLHTAVPLQAIYAAAAIG